MTAASAPVFELNEHRIKIFVKVPNQKHYLPTEIYTGTLSNLTIKSLIISKIMLINCGTLNKYYISRSKGLCMNLRKSMAVAILVTENTS